MFIIVAAPPILMSIRAEPPIKQPADVAPATPTTRARRVRDERRRRGGGSREARIGNDDVVKGPWPSIRIFLVPLLLLLLLLEPALTGAACRRVHRSVVVAEFRCGGDYGDSEEVVDVVKGG